MEQKEKNKIFSVVIATVRWLGFALFELILTGINLLVIGCVVYYFRYVTGPVERIEPESVVVSIKKVDGFYMIQDEEYSGYVERTFPDCTVKFHNKILTFKNGDVYDGRKKVTDKVEIQGTRSGFRVYYLNKSYPLKTLTKFDGSYKSRYGNVKEYKDMYANNGYFYIDVDNRHWFMNLFALCIVVGIILVFRYGISALTRRIFNKEYCATSDFIYDLPSKFKKKKTED